MPSGGKRKGAGRPKVVKSYSDQFKSSVWSALAKKAKEQKKTVLDLFADMLYTSVGRGHGQLQDAIWVSLWKSLAEVMAAKESHQTIEDKRTGPQIGLPPLREASEDDPRVATKKWKN